MRLSSRVPLSLSLSLEFFFPFLGLEFVVFLRFRFCFMNNLVCNQILPKEEPCGVRISSWSWDLKTGRERS